MYDRIHQAKNVDIKINNHKVSYITVCKQALKYLFAATTKTFTIRPAVAQAKIPRKPEFQKEYLFFHPH